MDLVVETAREDNSSVQYLAGDDACYDGFPVC